MAFINNDAPSAKRTPTNDDLDDDNFIDMIAMDSGLEDILNDDDVDLS